MTVLIRAGSVGGSAGGGSFRVTRSASQTGLIAAASNKIQFTVETLDADGYFDSVTNYRFLPTVAGYYLIGITTAAAANSESSQAIIFKNGSAYGTGGLYLASGAGTGNFISSQMDIIQFNGSTDYVEGFVYVPTGVTQCSSQCNMWGFRVS